MTINDDEIEDIVNELMSIFVNIERDNVLECVKMYVSMRSVYTKTDLINFIRVNIDLYNI